MALRRVPGSRNYFAEDKGFKEIALGSPMKAHMLEVGQKIASNANQRGRSKYDAKSTTVRVGWENEPRAGAVVSETERDWLDSRNAVLIRVLQAMTVRREKK